MAIDVFPEHLLDSPDGEGLAELQASRRRIVAAGDRARLQKANDLRDGPLRELRDLALELRLARGFVAEDQSHALAVLDDATARLDAAADVLCDVTRELFPAALAADPASSRPRGLRAALTTLGQRTPEATVVVSVEEVGPLPRAVEAAAYALAAEGIANATSHGRATVVEIDVRRDGDLLDVRVTDDGVGGAVLVPGGGLEAQCDRAAALGGHTSVESPQWAGTSLHAVLPLD
jgi:signal transduction histidine kinase